MGKYIKTPPRTFKVISSSFAGNKYIGNRTQSVYSFTVENTLDDVDRSDALVIGANIYERWFMSKGIKRWFFGLLVKRYKNKRDE